MKITVLGCGSSAGVPFIGCDCAVCTSSNPKNKRARVSLYIEINNMKLLVDSSPDLRQQCLREGIRRIDAVLYTHEHADHANGLDDLRLFNYIVRAAIPIYGTNSTISDIKGRFPYAFHENPAAFGYRPSLIPHIIPDGKIVHFKVEGIEIIGFEQIHGKRTTNGYRIGNFAYSTDTNGLEETAFEVLKGVDTWVVDCQAYTMLPSHAHLEMTLGWIQRVKPRLAVLTHMAHDFDYDKLAAELPSGVVPAYDGMVLEI